MIRTVFALVTHDLAVAFKNKTLFLMVCIPLFVYGTLMLVDRPDAPAMALRFAFLKADLVEPELRAQIESATELFSIRDSVDMEEGLRLLKKRELDGLVLSSDAPAQVDIIVLKKDSAATFAIVQRLSALQIAAQESGTRWLSAIRPLQTDAIERQSMPTWILMVVLLVSFFVLPAQVAEEKEKQWLTGLLQTPIRESEWLAAKLLYGMMLMGTATLALQVLGNNLTLHGAYLVTMGLGCFCFAAAGVMLGLLCRSQASARTLGVICYLPLLLPAALSEQSSDLRFIAPFLPSHAFYGPLQTILLDNTAPAFFPFEWMILLAMGTTACLISHRLIKVRWLM